MRIVFIGAGAMGSLFGALLAEAGADVWLLDIWEAHINAINEKGLTVEREGKTRSVKVNATTDPAQISQADLIVLFVKSTHTRVAAETAKGISNQDSFVMTLQNGMGNADILSEIFDPYKVVAGTTSHGATFLKPGMIRHAGIGPTKIGMWADGEFAQAQKIADFFSRSGIETDALNDVRGVLWEKLIINVGINAITALTGTKNGQILDLENTKELSRSAVDEAIVVAKAQGIEVRADAVEHVFQIAKATAQNRSSMGQDVDNKRQTEIEAINGVVVHEGQRIGIDTPVNKTLAALVETLQAHY